MRAKSLKSSQILTAHMPYFHRPSHIYFVYIYITVTIPGLQQPCYNLVTTIQQLCNQTCDNPEQPCLFYMG